MSNSVPNVLLSTALGHWRSLTPTRIIRNLSSTDPSCPERKESCRSELYVMRSHLRSRIATSNFVANVVLSMAAWSRKVSDTNKNDQEPILHRSIMSRTQRILPQWTYRCEIAFTVKDNGIELHGKHRIIYGQNAKVLLTLLSEQLQRTVSTLWKALDLPNNLVTIPGSLAPP